MSRRQEAWGTALPVWGLSRLRQTSRSMYRCIPTRALFEFIQDGIPDTAMAPLGAKLSETKYGTSSTTSRR